LVPSGNEVLERLRKAPNWRYVCQNLARVERKHRAAPRLRVFWLKSLCVATMPGLHHK
jgi:hypothetical protein